MSTLIVGCLVFYSPIFVCSTPNASHTWYISHSRTPAPITRHMHSVRPRCPLVHGKPIACLQATSASECRRRRTKPFAFCFFNRPVDQSPGIVTGKHLPCLMFSICTMTIRFQNNSRPTPFDLIWIFIAFRRSAVHFLSVAERLVSNQSIHSWRQLVPIFRYGNVSSMLSNTISSFQGDGPLRDFLMSSPLANAYSIEAIFVSSQQWTSIWDTHPIQSFSTLFTTFMQNCNMLLYSTVGFSPEFTTTKE